MEGLQACAQHPGLLVGAVRRSLGEHRESLLKYLELVDFGRALKASWNGTLMELRFPNKSMLRFLYAENVQDASRRQGGEYQLLLFDELTLTPPDVAGYLRSRIRSGRRAIPVLGVRASCNPGGIGHAYVYDRYIEPTKSEPGVSGIPGRQLATDAQGRSVRFIQAKATDNPYLDAGYWLELDAIPDPEMRRAMRDGDWDVYPNQSFTDWKIGRIEVEPFEIPAAWRRVAGMDWGWDSPSVVEWGAIDEDGRLWLYDELTLRLTPEAQLAEQILARQSHHGPNPPPLAADPAMWAARGGMIDIATALMQHGLSLTKAENERIAGKTRFHSYLAEAPACIIHRSYGWETCPKLHVFESACPGLVKTMPSLPRDPKRPEDVLKCSSDHWYDSCRYLIMSIGATAGPVLYGSDKPKRDPNAYSVPPPPSSTVQASPFV